MKKGMEIEEMRHIRRQKKKRKEILGEVKGVSCTIMMFSNIDEDKTLAIVKNEKFSLSE